MCVFIMHTPLRLFHVYDTHTYTYTQFLSRVLSLSLQGVSIPLYDMIRIYTHIYTYIYIYIYIISTLSVVMYSGLVHLSIDTSIYIYIYISRQEIYTISLVCSLSLSPWS